MYIFIKPSERRMGFIIIKKLWKTDIHIPSNPTSRDLNFTSILTISFYQPKLNENVRYKFYVPAKSQHQYNLYKLNSHIAFYKTKSTHSNIRALEHSPMHRHLEKYTHDHLLMYSKHSIVCYIRLHYLIIFFYLVQYFVKKLQYSLLYQK